MQGASFVHCTMGFYPVSYETVCPALPAWPCPNGPSRMTLRVQPCPYDLCLDGPARAPLAIWPWLHDPDGKFSDEDNHVEESYEGEQYAG